MQSGHRLSLGFRTTSGFGGFGDYRALGFSALGARGFVASGRPGGLDADELARVRAHEAEIEAINSEEVFPGLKDSR